MERRRIEVIVTWGVAVVGAVVLAVIAPDSQARFHLDHRAYAVAIGLIRDGVGVYQASIDGLATIPSVITQARSLREPWILALWSVIPPAALQPTFFIGIAGGSTAIAAPALRRPAVALLVGAWIATAGVFGGVDAWLLYELWAIPFVLGCCLAWLGGKDWLAAACALGALLLRETAVLLPLGMLAAAWALGRPVKPWLCSMGIAAAVLAVHWYWASDYLATEGYEAPLLGTGGLDEVVQMTSFLVLPRVLGLGLWVLGLVLLWRSALRGAIGLAAMPLMGLFVARPYWGFLAMPLCILALGGLPPWRVRSSPAAQPAPS